MTELSACHRQHHPIEQKVIHYYSQHEDTSGNVAGGRMDRVGRGVRGVVGGRRPCDKGRVRIKSGFKRGRVKKNPLFFFLSQTMPRGVCAPVRAPVCVKKA